MNISLLIGGLALQAGAFAVAWFANRLLYSMGWCGALVVAVPMFCASPFLLLNCGAPLGVRLLLSFWILAVPLWFIGVYLLEVPLVRTQVFLIPRGFRGRGRVEFGVPGGAPVERDGKRLVFRLGADGSLRSAVRDRTFASESLSRKRREIREFWFVEEDGTKERLEEASSYREDEFPKERVYVSLVGDHSEGRALLKVDFFVGTSDEVKRELNVN